MPWSETCRMDQRARFVLEHYQGQFTMSELCYRYGVSRKTGYKWVERYRRAGEPGCEDLPRAPLTHPNATPLRIVERVVKVRRRNPSWGPVTIRAFLQQKYPRTQWPSPSTIGEILKRHDLVRRRRRRRPAAPWQPGRTKADRPNRVWTADFKGQFRLGNGRYCYPLTIADAYSRYLLACHGLKGTSLTPARRVFEAAFKEYGLPDVMRTDNGVPFCAPGALLGLSRLSVWFLKLGIKLERSRPGKPQDNGAHERMHRTLKEDVAPRRTEAAQQRAMNGFRRRFNEQRPHHSLALQTPASRYEKSERTYPRDIPDPVYPGHYEVRRVTRIGVFWWHSRQIFLSNALRNEAVGLEYVAEGLWSVFYGDILLCKFDEAQKQIYVGAMP